MGIFKGNSIYKFGGGGGIKNIGAVPDASIMVLENNVYGHYTNTARNDLYFYVDAKDGETVNACIDIDNEISANVWVVKMENGVSVPLQVITSQSMAANEHYRLLIIGDTYEVSQSAATTPPDMFAKILGRVYPIVKIAGFYIMAENLRYDGMTHYVVNDQYFYHAREFAGKTFDGGWRIPDMRNVWPNIFAALDPDGVKKTMATNTGFTTWDNNAIGGSGLNLYPWGYYYAGEGGTRYYGYHAAFASLDWYFSPNGVMYVDAAGSWNYNSYNRNEMGNVRLVKEA